METFKTENIEQPDWFVLRTAVRSEVRIASLLESKGYEVLLPLGSVPHVSGKSVPIFPGYLFCQMDAAKPLPVLQTPGVQSLLAYGNRPVPLESSELKTLRLMAAAGPLPGEAVPGLCVGRPVRIVKGSLAGLEGVLAEIRSAQRVALRLNVLDRSVLLHIPQENIESC